MTNSDFLNHKKERRVGEELFELRRAVVVLG